jgi:hypothetical protein
LPPVAFVPAVDLRDCGDKVRILSNNPHTRIGNKPQVATSPGAVSVSRPHSSAADLNRDPVPNNNSGTTSAVPMAFGPGDRHQRNNRDRVLSVGDNSLMSSNPLSERENVDPSGLLGPRSSLPSSSSVIS